MKAAGAPNPLLVAAMVVGPAGPVGPVWGQVPTEARLLTVAKGLEQAVNARDDRAADRFLDRAALARRATDALDLSLGERLAAARDLHQTIEFGPMLVAAIGENGHYRLLFVERAATGSHATFRVVSDRGGLNYHRLAFDAEGSLFVDAYAYRSGEWLRDSLHRASLRALYAARGWHDWIPPTSRMDQLIERGWYFSGLQYFDSLPEKARLDRTLLLQRMLCAMSLDQNTIDRVHADLLRLFPEEPGADLLLLPHLIEHERWDAVLQTVGRLRTTAPPDAYLDAIAGTALLESGGIDRAAEYIDRFVAAEPTLEEAWSLRLRVALRHHDHEQTAEALAVLESRFGYQFQRIESREEFALFVGTDAHRRWSGRGNP